MYVYLTKYTKLAFVNFDWLNILYDGPWRAVLWVSLPTVIIGLYQSLNGFSTAAI